MPGVRVEDVAAVQPNPNLLAASLNQPKPHDASDGYRLVISGWVVGRSEPVQSISVVAAGRRSLVTAPVSGERPGVGKAFPTTPHAGRSGFWLEVGTVGLPREFEVELLASTAAGRRFRFATIKGVRDRVERRDTASLQPLIVNTLGRTGSTWVVSLLGAHPAVAAFRPTAHDARLGAYWMTVFERLSQPQSYLAPFAPQDMTARRWWLGEGGVRPLNAPRLESWLAKSVPGRLAEFCQRQIDAFYVANTDVDATLKPAYFIEKFVPRQYEVDLLREIYPAAREVILVRDFRDILCSVIAFNRKRGYQAFGRQRATSDAEYATTHFRNSALALADRWGAHQDTAHLIRYEDLITRPIESLQCLLAYLNLSEDRRTISGMLERAATQTSSGHRTTSNAESSIGRWRTDLSPELQAVCAEALGPALTCFGYEVGI